MTGHSQCSGAWRRHRVMCPSPAGCLGMRGHTGRTHRCVAISPSPTGSLLQRNLSQCGGGWRARESMSLDLWEHVQSCCPQAGSAGLSCPHVTATLLGLFAEESPLTSCWHPKPPAHSPEGLPSLEGPTWPLSCPEMASAWDAPELGVGMISAGAKAYPRLGRSQRICSSAGIDLQGSLGAGAGSWVRAL